MIKQLHLWALAACFGLLLGGPANADGLEDGLAVSHPCARMSVDRLGRRAEPYQAAINQYANEYKVEQAIIKAVIAIESCYNHQALSPKGAQGLMQLIPETAERFGVTDPFDTTQNIRGGTRYLGWLLERFDGSLEKVLAAYNAGEGRVDQYQGIPPYKETQAYVRNVLVVYNKLNKPTDATSTASLTSTADKTDALPLLAAGNAAVPVTSPKPVMALVAPAAPQPASGVPARVIPAVARVVRPAVQLAAQRAPAVPQVTTASGAGRVRTVFESPFRARPSKPGRGGLEVNKARAPHLYKQ